MQVKRPAIVVHGGAGDWGRAQHAAGLAGASRAAETGFRILERNGNAVDAVERAVMSMEDDETFNAGLGSSLNLRRDVEMEASIMDGKHLSAGAAGLLTDVRHPVCLARKIMEETDHVFVVGESAARLATLFGLARRDARTESKEKRWEELRSKLTEGKLHHLPRLRELLRAHQDNLMSDTVGAVAVDNSGDVAAATSTGGMFLKLPGRVGDSPLIGCGTYADNKAGACSATGIGEIAIRLVLAKSTCDLIRQGKSPQQATEQAIAEVESRIHSPTRHMGLIAVDANGNIGAAHNSPHLCWAFMTAQMASPNASLSANPR